VPVPVLAGEFLMVTRHDATGRAFGVEGREHGAHPRCDAGSRAPPNPIASKARSGRNLRLATCRSPCGTPSRRCL
jgi:hypothetical protein